MISFNADRPLRSIVVVGAHADDIEIGCSATILTLCRDTPGCEVVWLVCSADDARASEARASAEAFLAGTRARIDVHAFRDGYFPSQHADIKQVFADLGREVDPDLVFTHASRDAHQDHRVVSELTWNTFRDHTILEYEIPKWDGDLGRPNAYAVVDAATAARKCDLLEEHFVSQRDKQWFDRETFLGLMRLRGVECASPTRYAEAFHARKIRVLT